MPNRGRIDEHLVNETSAIKKLRSLFNEILYTKFTCYVIDDDCYCL